jgi:hypothetical protein
VLGIVSLVTDGVRSYYRAQRRAEISRYHQELAAEIPEQLVSSTAPARTRLLDSLQAALVAAAPAGLSVTEQQGLWRVGDVLIVDIAPVGCSSRVGRSADHVSSSVATYWVIDPVWPSLTVLQLQDGAYVETARHDGPVFVAERPFPVSLRLQAD